VRLQDAFAASVVSWTASRNPFLAPDAYSLLMTIPYLFQI
jgi:hypothetical protein